MTALEMCDCGHPPNTPEACRALVDNWIRAAEHVKDPVTLRMIRARCKEVEAYARKIEQARA